ncbi:MAG: pentapeptide repeat-containing protein [Bradyrhizobium sp.]
MSVLIVPLVFVAIFAGGAFFWFWWAAPQAQVPLHLDADQLRQLELQDRLRQTSYQILTGLGLVSSFIAAAVQLWITSNQWSADYALRLLHEQNQQFAEATKNLVEAGDKPYAQLAAQRVTTLASENPEAFGRQTITILESVVVGGTMINRLAESHTCTVDTGMPDQKWPVSEVREEPPPAAQAAVQQLGSRPLAMLRRSFTGSSCIDGADRKRLNFANLRLDNFDFSGLDLSCSLMSQANLRRVSFRYANLFGADLRGARLADYDIPKSPASTGMLLGTPYGNESVGFDDPRRDLAKAKGRDQLLPRLPVWQTYRCFITDLRDADLRGVNFENASLGGADFRGANLTGANLCGATVSRANFSDTRGLTADMLKDVCVGRPEDDDSAIKASQPFGLQGYFSNEFKSIKRCSVRSECAPMDAQGSNALINQPRR